SGARNPGETVMPANCACLLEPPSEPCTRWRRLMRSPLALATSALALAAGVAWAEQPAPAPPGAPTTPTQSASAAAPASPIAAPAPAGPTRAQLWAACVNVGAAQQAIETCSQIIQSN